MQAKWHVLSVAFLTMGCITGCVGASSVGPAATPTGARAAVTLVPTVSRDAPASRETPLTSAAAAPTVSATATNLPTGGRKVTLPAGSTLVDGKKVGEFTVWLISTPNSPTRGNTVFEAVVADANGNAVDDAKVSFDLDMTNMSHGKNVVDAAPQGSGRYAGKVFFLMGGPWRIILTVQRPGQPQASERFTFSVGR